jgi:hypothetical protein
MPGTNSSDSKYSLNQNRVTRTIDPLVIIENSHSEMSIIFIIKKNGKGKLKNKNLLTSISFSPWYFFARLPPIDFCSWSFSPAVVFWKILSLNTVSYFPAELLPQPDPLSLSVGFLQPPLYSLDISALSIFLCRTPAAVLLPPARWRYPLRRFGLQKSWLPVFISSQRRP